MNLSNARWERVYADKCAGVVPGSAWELRETESGDLEWSRSGPAPLDALPSQPQPIPVPEVREVMP